MSVREHALAWSGQPITAHWGVEDPAEFQGPEHKALQYFKSIYLQLESRVKLFTSLPLDSLNRLSLQERLNEIGAGKAEEAKAVS